MESWSLPPLLYLFIYLFIYFWPRHTACGILVSQPGVKPAPPALQAQSLNQWTAREVPDFLKINFLTTRSYCIAQGTIFNIL